MIVHEWLRNYWERLRSSYWFIPALMATTAAGLAFGGVYVDELYGGTFSQYRLWLYTGGAEGARAVLATIAGSIITVAGTTFSITIAALSFASSQFGPRLLRNFMRDTGNQVVLGTFTSTFLYCILVLRTVVGEDERIYVPHLSVTFGVVLAVLSLGVLIYFIHHIAESIQVGYLIQTVGLELDDTVERLFPAELAEPAGHAESQDDFTFEVCADRSGYIQAIDENALLASSRDADLSIRLLLRPGDYAISGMALAVMPQAPDPKIEAQIRRSFVMGRTRTPHQDAPYAFLQLAEIAVRALSPSMNDPFTAVMCVDRITKAMAMLVSERSLPEPLRRDPDGKTYIVARPHTYDDLIEAAFGHIYRAALNQPYVLSHVGKQVGYISERARDPQFRAALARRNWTGAYSVS